MLVGLLLVLSCAAAGAPPMAPVGSAARWAGGVALAQAPAATSEATLLLYSTVERLLGGEVVGGATVAQVRAALARYPADWPLVGVGTTGWVGRNGELMPDGTAGAPHFWWADPGSPSEAAVSDLGSVKGVAGPDAPLRLPFLGLAVGNPATAQTWTAADVDDVHAWLTERLSAEGITLAGVQLHGQFGPVQTTVAHYLPPTGLDLSGGYVGADYFRFGDYPPATWTMVGLYAADPALQPAIAAPGAPLHLHGYQPAARLGGHITRAAARRVTATIWPLDGTYPLAASSREPDGLWLLRGPTHRDGCGCLACA
jgi:hypothetical protein